MTDHDHTADCAAVGHRLAFTKGLRDLSAWLDEHPDAPLPHHTLAQHIEDADEFDAAASAMGCDPSQHYKGAPYWHATRRFGPVSYDVQNRDIDRVVRDLRRGEAALVAREASAGVAP